MLLVKDQMKLHSHSIIVKTPSSSLSSSSLPSCICSLISCLTLPECSWVNCLEITEEKQNQCVTCDATNMTLVGITSNFTHCFRCENCKIKSFKWISNMEVCLTYWFIKRRPSSHSLVVNKQNTILTCQGQSWCSLKLYAKHAESQYNHAQKQTKSAVLKSWPSYLSCTIPVSYPAIYWWQSLPVSLLCTHYVYTAHIYST